MTLKEGKRVNYKSRVHGGVGKIVRLYTGGRGDWVVIHDKERGKEVTVRPSQVLS